MAQIFFCTEAASGHYYPGHPECPARVAAAAQYLRERLQLDQCAQASQLADCPAVSDELLLAVHTGQYLAELRDSLGKVAEPTALRDLDDPDGCTFAAASTWQDALRAVSCAMALTDAVLQGGHAPEGRADGEGGACGFGLCRPPGHHATPSEGMGFCLLNNAAIAARHAQRAHGLQRVMILDWDVHHGNGTQDVFYEDPSVLFVDLHQAEVWPGSGAAEEVGAGAGRGCTINVPLPWHTGHSGIQRVFEAVVAPAARRFHPELIIVSAGYDAHWQDPLEHLRLQSATYHWLAGAVQALALELCHGRCLLLLEGGYHVEALAESVGETVLGLLGRPPATQLLPAAALPGALPEPLEEVEAVVQRVRGLHQLP